MKKMLVGVFSGIICSVLFCGCGNETPQQTVSNTEQSDEVYDTDTETNAVIEEISETEEYNSEPDNEQPFVSDYSEGEKNYIGNPNLNNLHIEKWVKHDGEIEFKNGGRITKQGNWVYYYELNTIYKFNTKTNECRVVANNPKATYLNVVGDYLYFIEDSTRICKMRTDGEEKETIQEDIVPAGLFVTDDFMTYVTKDNASATTFEYTLHIKDYKDSGYALGCGETPPFVVYVDDKNVYFYCVPVDQNATYIELFKCFKTESKWEQTEIMYDGVPEDGWGSYRKSASALYNDGKIIVLAAGVGYESKTDRFFETVFNYVDVGTDAQTQYKPANRFYPTITNFYKGQMISNRFFQISIIDQDFIDTYQLDAYHNGDGSLGENIVSEKEDIPEVYTFDDLDYLFYTVSNGDGYNKEELYKINIDGTGWEKVTR